MAQGGESLDRLQPGGERSGNAAEAATSAPPSGGPGEFTRMFRSLGAEPQATELQSTELQATELQATELQTAAAAAPASAASSSRQPLTPGPREPASFAPAKPLGEFTAPTAGSAGSEGFTEIFQQIRKPTSAPPEIRKPEASASASGAEGFTQIFSSFQARSEPARPAVPPPLPEQRPATHFAQTPAPTPSAPSAAARGATVAPVPPATPAFGERMQDPGEFTQLFEQIGPPSPAGPAPQTPFVPKPQRMERDSAFGSPAPAGSLTETFRSTPAEKAPAAVPPVRDSFGPPAAPFAGPAPQNAAPQAAAASADSFTEMFRSPAAPANPQPARDNLGQSGAPFAGPAPTSSAAPAGSFTDMFRSPVGPASQPARDAFGRQPASFAGPPPPPAAAPSGESSFTQLFQSLSANPAQPPAQAPLSAPPSPAPPSAPAFGGSAGPVYPAQSAAAPAAGGGEFTRLMHSLEQPATAPSPAVLPTAPLPFFAEAPQSSSPSEFTRVMRGTASRDAGASRPAAPAVVSAPVAPGMAIAPGKKDEKAETKPAGKSKQMVMLLVIFNVILVIAVILLAVILLRRH